MPKVSGQGGNVTIGSFTYPVIEWSADLSAVIDDVTDTGSDGWAEGLRIVKKLNSFEFSTYETGAIELTNSVGSTITVTGNLGNGGGNITISNTILRSVQPRVDAQRAVRITVQCEYGSWN
jgi:hypothetical protein